MAFAGIPSADERADVLAYLRSLVRQSGPAADALSAPSSIAGSTARPPTACITGFLASSEPAARCAGDLCKRHIDTVSRAPRLVRRLCSPSRRPAPAGAGEPEWRHAHSLLGEPKYPAGFRHFDYVNPDAPKGGLVRLGVQGTFDNFNLFVAGVKGAARDAASPHLRHADDDGAATRSATEYGLLAEAVRHPPDNFRP